MQQHTGICRSGTRAEIEHITKNHKLGDGEGNRCRDQVPKKRSVITPQEKTPYADWVRDRMEKGSL